MKKEYTNGEITVVWQPDKCIHCAECAKGLGEVFKPRQKPWIQMGTVSSEDIKTQVEKCPSGAISLKD
ncbi:MAG: (4Fe-4S)-binding protein [Flavobacteriales bacterium]